MSLPGAQPAWRKGAHNTIAASAVCTFFKGTALPKELKATSLHQHRLKARAAAGHKLAAPSGLHPPIAKREHSAGMLQRTAWQSSTHHQVVREWTKVSGHIHHRNGGLKAVLTSHESRVSHCATRMSKLNTAPTVQ